MDKELIKHFQDGITIDKLRTGKYSVFTVKTQRFTINTLDELTPEVFKNAIIELEKRHQLENELMEAALLDALQDPFQKSLLPNQFNPKYFEEIINFPITNDFTMKTGEVVQVGPKFLLEIAGTVGYPVYLYKIDDPHNSNENKITVTFIIIDTAVFQQFNIAQLKKIAKKITLIT